MALTPCTAAPGSGDRSAGIIGSETLAESVAANARKRRKRSFSLRMGRIRRCVAFAKPPPFSAHPVPPHVRVSLFEPQAWRALLVDSEAPAGPAEPGAARRRLS